MNTELSLEQAPPISVPFRFFITAPLFGIAAAILLMLYGPSIFLSRWNPETLALTHLLTLGFMGLIMCGATMQVLPVISGYTVPFVKPITMLVHALLVTGIITFATSLLLPSQTLMSITLALLGGGFGIFITAIMATILKISNSNPTVSAMRLALASLLVTVLLGLGLLSTFLWPVIILPASLLTDLHATWGMLGWTALLLIGVAYQVVPMFQMTAHYPRWMTRFLAPMLFAVLVMWSIIALSTINSTDIIMLLTITAYSSFSITTLWLQHRRRRRTHDTTLLFWQFSMLSALAAAILWITHTLAPDLINSDRYPFVLGVILLPGFAISAMNGMLYKIIPFLIWFHLQHRQLSLGLGRKYAIPNMKKIIPAQLAQRQLILHISGVLTLILASIFPNIWLIYLAGFITATSFSLLSYNLIKATLLYRDYDRRLKAASTPSNN